MNFMSEAEAIKDELVADRRYFHENPELSDEEENTVRFICDRLKKLGIRYIVVPKGGILGIIGCADKKSEPKTVLLRADIDALKILESDKNLLKKKQCVSKTPGVAHLCGHDAHTAMLLGAAKMIKEHEDELIKDNKRVILAFELHGIC